MLFKTLLYLSLIHISIVNYLKGIKIGGDLIDRLLLKKTEVEELSDTDVMSALRVLAEDVYKRQL